MAIYSNEILPQCHYEIYKAGLNFSKFKINILEIAKDF